MTPNEIKLEDIQETLLDGLKDAIKARFATIAANALSQNVATIESEFRNAFENLKATHDVALRIAEEVFF